eukprot:gene5722-9007_t
MEHQVDIHPNMVIEEVLPNMQPTTQLEPSVNVPELNVTSMEWESNDLPNNIAWVKKPTQLPPISLQQVENHPKSEVQESRQVIHVTNAETLPQPVIPNSTIPIPEISQSSSPD